MLFYSSALLCSVTEVLPPLGTFWLSQQRSWGVEGWKWRQDIYYDRRHASDSDTEMRKGKKQGKKKSLRGFWRGDITDLTTLEVLGLSVLFVTDEHSVLLEGESKLKVVASWKQWFIIPLRRFVVKDLPFATHFPLQGEGISCGVVICSVELWVRCSFAILCRIRMCEVRLDLAAFKGLSSMLVVGRGYLSLS